MLMDISISLADMLEHGIERQFIRPALRQLLFIDDSPDAVLDHLVSHKGDRTAPK